MRDRRWMFALLTGLLLAGAARSVLGQTGSKEPAAKEGAKDGAKDAPKSKHKQPAAQRGELSKRRTCGNMAPHLNNTVSNSRQRKVSCFASEFD